MQTKKKELKLPLKTKSVSPAGSPRSARGKKKKATEKDDGNASKKKEKVPTIIAPDDDFNPKPVLDEFVSLTKVQKMILEATEFINDQLPKVKEEIKEQNVRIHEFYNHNRSMMNQMGQMKEQMKELNMYEQRINNLQLQITNNMNRSMEHHGMATRKYERLSTHLDEMEAKLARLQVSLDTKSQEILDIGSIQEDKQNKLVDKMEKFIEKSNQRSERFEHDLRDINFQQGKMKASTSKLHEQIKGELKDMIKHIFERSLVESEKIQSMEGEIRSLKISALKISYLTGQVDQVTKMVGGASVMTEYIEKGLPLQIHMHICEAFEKIIGKEFRPQLIEFERAKIKELFEYNKTVNSDCIRILLYRLTSFLDFMNKKDKGTISLTYGEDVSPILSDQEIVYINRAYDIYLDSRFEQSKKAVDNCNECFDLITRKNRSTRLLHYRLNELNDNMVLKLFQKVIEYKVKKLKVFDNVDLVFNECAPYGHDQSVRESSNPRKNSIAGFSDRSSRKPQSKPQQNVHTLSPHNLNSNTLSPKNIPSFNQMPMQAYGPQIQFMPVQNAENSPGGTQVTHQMFSATYFLIKRDKLNNYRRFDKKFQTMFEVAINDYTQFKKLQIDNFAHTTQMQMDLALEVNDIKKVISTQHEQLDDYEDTKDFLEKLNGHIQRVEKQASFFHDEVALLNRQMKEQMMDVMGVIGEQERKMDHKIQEMQEQILKIIKNGQFSDQVSHHHGGGTSRKSVAGRGHHKGKKTSASQMRASQSNMHDALSAQSSTEKQIQPSQVQTLDIPNTHDGDDNWFQANLSPRSHGSKKSSRGGGSQKPKIEKVDTKPLSKTIKAGKGIIDVDSLEDPKDSGSRAGSARKQALNSTFQVKKKAPVDEQKRREKLKEEQTKKLEREKKEREEKQRLKEQQEKQKADAQRKERIAKRQEIRNELKIESEQLNTGHKFMNNLVSQEGAIDKQTGQMSKKLKKIHKKDEEAQPIALNFTSVKRQSTRAGLKINLGQIQKHSQPSQSSEENTVKEVTKQSEDEEDDSLHTSLSGSEESPTQKKQPALVGVIKRGNKLLRKKTVGTVLSNIANISQLSPEKLRQFLEPRLGELRNNILTEVEDILADEIRELTERYDTEVASLRQEIQDQIKNLEHKARGDDEKLNKDINFIITEMQAQVQHMNQHINSDSSELVKLKTETRYTIKTELERMNDMKKERDQEMKKLNAYMENSSMLLQYLLEDSMINQLLIEQDIQDRKQIGLFGTKKNSDIMGLNQGAMSNNYIKSPINAAKSKEKLWQLKDKDKSYNDVVGLAPLKDSKMNKVQKEMIKSIRHINDSTQVHSDFGEMLGGTERVDKPYNTLFIDKNCASCSGFAPQILKQIKLACLSYVNSPIQFGLEQLSFQDLIQVKEMILKKCETYSDNIQRIQDLEAIMLNQTLDQMLQEESIKTVRRVLDQGELKGIQEDIKPPVSVISNHTELNPMEPTTDYISKIESPPPNDLADSSSIPKYKIKTLCDLIFTKEQNRMKSSDRNSIYEHISKILKMSQMERGTEAVEQLKQHMIQKVTVKTKRLNYIKSIDQKSKDIFCAGLSKEELEKERNYNKNQFSVVSNSNSKTILMSKFSDNNVEADLMVSGDKPTYLNTKSKKVVNRYNLKEKETVTVGVHLPDTQIHSMRSESRSKTGLAGKKMFSRRGPGSLAPMEQIKIDHNITELRSQTPSHSQRPSIRFNQGLTAKNEQKSENRVKFNLKIKV